jgi:Domain of unknown function (DUF4384)
VDSASGGKQEVDADSNFKSGDCLQVRMRPNRGGRLYVFNHGSSGDWHMLLPSALASNEPTNIAANADVTVGRDVCFAVDNNKGVDKLLILLTEKEEDANKLDEEMRGLTMRAKGASEKEQAVIAMNKVTGVLKGSDQGPLVSRDLSIQKIAKPMEQGEPANSVYVVKTAATPNERLVIEIPIRHE